METWMNEVVFTISNTPITVAKLLIAGLLSLLFVSIVLLFNYWFYHKLKKTNAADNEVLKNRTKTYLLIIWGIIYICFRTFDLQYQVMLFDTEYTIGIRPIIQIILLFLLAYYLDFVLSKLFVQNYYIKTEKNIRDRDKIGGKNAGLEASKLIKRLVYISVLLYLINTFDVNYTLFSYKSFVIDISGI